MSLVYHYKLNETATATSPVVDSKSGNDGVASTDMSSLTASGKINNSFDFAGSEVVQVSNVSAFNNASVFSIAFWANANVIADGQLAIGYNDSGVESLGIYPYETDRSLNSQFKLKINGIEVFAVARPEDFNEWHHYVYIRNGLNFHQWWLDGVEQGTDINTFPPLGSTLDYLEIGALDAKAFFDGRIDDVRVFDTAITSGDIAFIYNGGFGTEAEGGVYITGESLSMALQAPSVIIDTDVAIDAEQGLSLAVSPTIINMSGDVKIIVTNARTFAISNYASFAFNSMAMLNNKYLYANANGIYESGGDNDAGVDIPASYKAGVININKTEVQKLRNAFLNYRSDGDIQLFSVGDEEVSRQYALLNYTPDGIHERRLKFERGIRENYFSFGISNMKGSSFEIKTAKILTEPIRKRR